MAERARSRPKKARASWRDKLHEEKGLPKTMVIPSPREVDALMRLVPEGKVTTIADLGKALARKHRVSIACPMTTGLFAWIAAHAAEEDRAEGVADASPWWRTLKTGGALNPKYPGGLVAQRRLLEAEGHRVVRRGKDQVVADLEDVLHAFPPAAGGPGLEVAARRRRSMRGLTPGPAPGSNRAMDLEIVTVVVSPFEQNCRVVVDRATRESVVIDPGDEAARILDAVRATRSTPRWILNTHAHIDHAGAVLPVKKALGVPFALHAADLPILSRLSERGLVWGMPGVEVPEVDLDLATVETVPFGSGAIRILGTPGHTPGGVTFLIGTHGFFGDTLFRLSVGRTDLGGDAEVYARTLRDVVLRLPDDVVVHTGHGPDTTIGAERRENPFLLHLRRRP